MRYHGHARVDPTAPSAFAVCDRCGKLYNHTDLSWQYDWRGPQLANLGLLVCRRTCLDKPAESRRIILLPPDPLPIANARPEQYAVEEA